LPEVLSFFLHHRQNNVRAVVTFDDFRCTVTDPAGVRADATGQGLEVAGSSVTAQYRPNYFRGAPLVRNGSYAYTEGPWTRTVSGTVLCGGPTKSAGFQPRKQRSNRRLSQRVKRIHRNHSPSSSCIAMSRRFRMRPKSSGGIIARPSKSVGIPDRDVGDVSSQAASQPRPQPRIPGP
jgi:hypothetical protein